MKFLLLCLLCISIELHATDVRGNCGFKADLCGEQIFPASYIPAKALMGLQAEFVKDELFASCFVEIYPNDTSANPTSRKDSLKYFPKLLGNNMSINFDASKYHPLSPITTDTTLATAQNAALNKTTKNRTPTTILPQTPTAKPVATPTTPKETTVPAQKKDTIPAAVTQRPTNLIHTYQVSTPHITVQLFDDGQIDGDAVSVYYNGKLVINNQTLTHKPIGFSIEASATNRHHELVLISESEGFIPPNTALMRISAGSQQFELNVSSSSERNAKIVIDYTGE